MEKKVPIRTCIACKTAKPKKELLRVIKFNDEIDNVLSEKVRVEIIKNLNNTICNIYQSISNYRTD